MFVSPAEPAALRSLGYVSSLPESLGVDFLWPSTQGLVGVQRKTVDDLVGSVRDGRLQKEIAQMAGLAVAELLVEGRPQWTSDGALIGYGGMTRTGYRNLLRSVMAGGMGVSHSDNVEDTVLALEEFGKWASKEIHASLVRRPGPVGTWGKPSSREWCLHILQGFDNLGPGKAAAILDYFGGLPLGWTVTEEELMQVPGIGEKTARGLVEGLGRRFGDDGRARQAGGKRKGK